MHRRSAGRGEGGFEGDQAGRGGAWRGQRAARWQAYKTANVTCTHIYLGALMEKVTQGSTVDWKHYLFAEGQAVTLYSRKSTGVNTLTYLLRDYQGSVDVLTGSTGAVTVRESFDPYGQRRGTAWSGAPSSADLATINGLTRRGYTGHEMLDSTGLNPLSCTDPGGFNLMRERPHVRPITGFELPGQMGDGSGGLATVTAGAGGWAVWRGRKCRRPCWGVLWWFAP